MTNEKVILAFLEGKKAHTPTRQIQNGIYLYEGRTLESLGDTLYNYNTQIAYIKEGVLYLNTRKYSSTTSRIQSLIKRLATDRNIQIIEFNN